MISELLLGVCLIPAIFYYPYFLSKGGMPALLTLNPNALAFFLIASGPTSTLNARSKRGSFFSFSLGI